MSGVLTDKQAAAFERWLRAQWCSKRRVPSVDESAAWGIAYAQGEKKAVDLTKCPQCGGLADNGHDRCYPPNPYHCSKCQALDDDIDAAKEPQPAAKEGA